LDAARKRTRTRARTPTPSKKPRTVAPTPGEVAAYFDANVFGHIARRDRVIEADAANLLAAAKDGRVRVLVSTDDIDEIADGFEEHPEEATEKLRVLAQLTDFERNVLRPLFELLPEDVQAFAERRPLGSRRVDRATGRRVAARVAQWITSGNVPPEYRRALDEFRQGKLDFASGLQNSTPEILEVWKAVQKRIEDATGKKVRQIPFEQYRGPMASRFIAALVKRFGWQKAFRRRSIAELRQTVRLVDVYGELSAAFAYAQTFEGRKAQPSDSPDMRHAAIATCARVFVTHDKKLRRLVERAAIGVEVVDLPEFIERYVRRKPPGE
jgi:predicted nucleic acid-binding protein